MHQLRIGNDLSLSFMAFFLSQFNGGYNIGEDQKPMTLIETKSRLKIRRRKDALDPRCLFAFIYLDPYGIDNI